MDDASSKPKSPPTVYRDTERNEQKPGSSLCTSCQKWDFERELLPRSPDDVEARMRIDELEKVRNAVRCPMCRLRLSALRAIPGFDNITWQKSAFVHTSPMIFGGYHPHPGSVQKTWIARIWVQLLIDTNNWSSATTGTSFSQGIQLLADDSKVGSSSQLLKGRPIPEANVDFRLLGLWTSKCSREHGITCAPHPLTIDFGLRLIDIRRRCVVNAPRECRYLALSYVWGNAKQLILEQKTYVRLTNDGGLADDCADVSQSIKDAMLLCETLQEPYLWVDALCIKQDDDVDRSRQIANMDAVYGGATFTIVAAAGKPGVGASAGIPGIRPGTRSLMQTTETVKGLKYQVFYHCSKATWYEDAILESDPEMEIDLSLNEGLLHRRHHNKLSPNAPAIDQYTLCVSDYARRALRFDTDALNAFAGIINMLRPKLARNFFWGMPESVFDIAMTWRWHNHFPERRRRMFPSWSWVAIRAGPNDDLDPKGGTPSEVRSEIVWYRKSADNGRYLPIGNDAVSKFDASAESSTVRTAWRPIGSPTEPISYVKGQGNLECLFFWTSSAFLAVDREGPEGERSHGSDRLNIRDVDGNPISCIYLNTMWRKEQPDNLEFIVICSYVSQYRRGWGPGVMVILIEWEGQVAFRVQRADTPIDHKAWAKAKPEWKFITLG